MGEEVSSIAGHKHNATEPSPAAGKSHEEISRRLCTSDWAHAPEGGLSGGLLLFRGDKAFALGLLAGQLPGAPDRLTLFAGALFGRLLKRAPGFHFTENTLALQLSFENSEGLVDIVVADENLQCSSFFRLVLTK